MRNEIAEVLYEYKRKLEQETNSRKGVLNKIILSPEDLRILEYKIKIGDEKILKIDRLLNELKNDRQYI